MKWLSGAITVVAIILAGFFFNQKKEAEREKKEAELSVGLNASRMINVSFQRQIELNVLKLQGHVVTAAECKGRIFHPIQRTKAPVFVTYTVNLKSINSSSYGWNPEQKILTIQVPDVKVGTPDVDETKQVVRQDGVYISRTCGLVLARQTASRLVDRASAEANKSENIEKARQAARDAITSFATGTLTGAGLSDIRVAVRFPHEDRRNENEHWDESRPIADVLAS